jgi:N-acetylglucosamine-6-phosphate deacetylase
MDQALTHVIRFAGVDLPAAVQMALQNGTRLFSDLGAEIEPGCPADLVLFEYPGRVVIQKTWIRGEEVSKDWEGIVCKGG